MTFSLFALEEVTFSLLTPEEVTVSVVSLLVPEEVTFSLLALEEVTVSFALGVVVVSLLVPEQARDDGVSGKWHQTLLPRSPGPAHFGVERPRSSPKR